MPINIHGKQYATVSERIQVLHQATSGKYSIDTSIERWADGVVVIKATLTIPECGIYAGHSYEKEGSTQINKTSALENCETSAIGRALAAAGFGGTEYASANEVQNAIHQSQNNGNGNGNGHTTQQTSANDESKAEAFAKAIDELHPGSDVLSGLLKEFDAGSIDEIEPADRKKFYEDLKTEITAAAAGV